MQFYRFYLFIILFQFYILFLPKPLIALKVQNLYQKASNHYHQLYRPTRFRKFKHNWLKTIKEFKKIYTNYPNSKEAPKAIYNTGKLYFSLYKWNRNRAYIDKSINEFKKLISNYQTSYLADDAWFLIIKNHYTRKEIKSACLEYQKYKKQFIHSRFFNNARKLLRGKNCNQYSNKQDLSRSKNFYEKQMRNYNQLYHANIKDFNWQKKIKNTIEQFKRIYTIFPQSEEAAKSYFNNCKLYRILYLSNYDQVYLDFSNISCREVVKKYLKSNFADQAQFILAENYELYKKNPHLAYIEYERLNKLFPNSKFFSKSQQKIKKLGGIAKNKNVTETNIINPSALSIPRYGGLSKKESKKHPPVKIINIDYWSSSEWSRLVINTQSEIRYKYHALKPDAKNNKKQRIYIDILNSYLPFGFKKKIASNDGIIKQCRIAQFNKTTVRVVLDVLSLKKVKMFNFKLSDQNKIIMDVLGHPSNNKAVKEEPYKTSFKEKNIFNKKDLKDLKALIKPTSKKDISLKDALGLKIKTIILDPGHGGKDPGAIGINRIKEKHLTLKISKFLKKIIKRYNPKLKVLLTRRNDRFIPLEERTAFANKSNGDLFISIHINASNNRRVKGIETYFLNLTADQEALQLAAKENQFSMHSMSGLEEILHDLMVGAKTQESSKLAENIQQTMIQKIETRYSVKDLGVKKAPFVVLIGAQMPSILIEAGFITNPQEKKRLCLKNYQKLIAEGIYQGIQTYIKNVPTFSKR